MAAAEPSLSIPGMFRQVPNKRIELGPSPKTKTGAKQSCCPAHKKQPAFTQKRTSQFSLICSSSWTWNLTNKNKTKSQKWMRLVHHLTGHVDSSLVHLRPRWLGTIYNDPSKSFPWEKKNSMDSSKPPAIFNTDIQNPHVK